MSSVCSGVSTWPSGSGTGTTNGSAGAAALVTVTLRFPVSEIVSVLVADVPTGTDPKSREPGAIDSWANPTAALPVRGTVAAPSGPVTVKDEESSPAAVGA